MVGQNYLPDEGDQDFQGLIRQFMEPTREDILTSRYDQSSHPENAFSAVFYHTSQLTFPIPENQEPNSIPLSFILHWMITACYGLGEMFLETIRTVTIPLSIIQGQGKSQLSWGPWQTLRERKPSVFSSGNLQCAYTMCASSKLLTAVQFMKGSIEENKIKGEVPYGLFLLFAAFNKDPARGEYASFVINMRSTSLTCLQITKLVASGSYLQALCQGKPLEEHLKIYRSHGFDLVEPEGRKAFLVMFMGVVNYVMKSPE
ncbi:hypothetical protein Asppvi_009997 [Aspergillus pseudoviridinutans]|uniref:Uncharacterized protein n=1 Tax=Aspergillus pseudoviridinutans TaxID=1517512 RepID=A0A9P3BH18_9EURO|nr:uncharacterized protein Asppvi_009997 [Aspergillus pseudoviridinutans]GIJ91032.1 hypothetical protein Asppvi_009997 [Aspergillus pseudoviridinutans]